MRPAVADYSTRPIVNLATNPSFETPAGTVEVHRNRFPNPAPAGGISGWGPQSGMSQSPTAEGMLYTAIAARPNSALLGGSSTSSPAIAAVPASTVVYGTIEVRPSRTMGLRAVLNERDASSTQVAQTFGTSVTCPAGVWTTLSIVGTTSATTTAGGVRSALSTSEIMAIGETVEMRHMYVSLVPGNYFDGSHSPDPDLTPSWVSAENSSESVLSGVGLSGAGGDTFRKVFSSQQWAGSGSRSVRVLSLDGISTGWGVIANNLPNKDGQLYTVLAKCRTLTARNVQLRVDRSGMAGITLYQGSVNGEAILRGTYTGSSAGTSARLVQGGFATSGIGDSTWWDEAMIVEGIYRGGYRDGDSHGWRWHGASHQSASSGPGGP